MRKSILVIVVLLLVPLSGCTGVPRLIRASIMLPDQAANGAAKIVEGVGQGLSGDYVPPPSVTYIPQQTEVVYYYNQPMYSAPPINPGYQFEYWYMEPNNGIVFYTGNEYRRHSYQHSGNYNGHNFQHRGQGDRRQHAQHNRHNRGKGDHHLSDRERREARERAKKNRHDK